MDTNPIIFSLGAVDPEMLTISRLLTAAGVPWRWAREPAAVRPGDRVVTGHGDAATVTETSGPRVAVALDRDAGTDHPGAWWDVAELTRLDGSPCGAPCVRNPGAAYAVCDDRQGAAARVWVECRPAGLSRAELEARGDVVIDHHDTRHDPMANAPPESAVDASSLGQVFAFAVATALELEPREDIRRGSTWAARLADVMAAGYAERPCPFCEKWFDLSSPDGGPTVDCEGHRPGRRLVMRSDLRIAGALDHALHAALGGLVPGVDRDDALRAAAEMAADRELAAMKGTAPEAGSPEAYIAQVSAAESVLRGARKLTLGGLEVCDLLDHVGKIPALPVAASHACRAYVVEAPARPGTLTTCAIGGATTPAAVRVFAEIAREAFAAARTPELEALADLGAARGGVYAFPERGMAGVYLPARSLVSFLRDPMEIGFADILVGDSAFARCLHLACEHPTASGDAAAEIRALRETARAAVNRGYSMGRVHG